MRLEALEVELRPRGAWEAVDLGFRMVQRWWRPIFGAWLALALPLGALLALLAGGRAWLALLALWWLLPLVERLPLYVVSEALFGHVPAVRETLRAAPRLLARQWLAALTLRRLSPSRSSIAPVVLLEGLEGRVQSERIRALRWRSGGAAALLGAACLGFALLSVGLGLVLCIEWLAPDAPLVGSASLVDWSAWAGASPLVALALALGLLVIGPFHAAAGFSLYIHRRIWLEGWDIELVFRGLARRRAAERTAASLLLAAIACLAAGSAAAAPETEPARAGEVLERIFEEPELRGWTEVRSWRRIGAAPEFEFSDPPCIVRLAEWAGQVLRIALWLALAAFGVLLLRWLARLGRDPPPPAPVREAHALEIAGLDLRPESLPGDVVAAARAAWGRGASREALALLYRGALAHLVAEHALEIGPGATEAECLRRSAALAEVAGDFARLTRAWQSIAYAQRSPPSAAFEALCAAWGARLGVRT